MNMNDQMYAANQLADYDDQQNQSSIIISERGSVNGSMTARSSSNQMHALPVQFHLKTIFWQNLIVPPLYLTLNIFVTAILIQAARQLAEQDYVLAYFGLLQLPLFAFVTIMFYLYSSYVNPGYVIGDEEVQLAKAQDYDLRHQRSKSRQNQASTMHGGLQSDAADGQIGSVMSGYAGGSQIPNSHQRQKSVLHKDLHLVSRHDRNKSHQNYNTPQFAGAAQPNNPSMRLATGSDFNANYLPSQQYELANMESQPSTQHDRMVSRQVRGSELPGGYDSTMSLQLYGGNFGHNASPEMGNVVTTVANNIQSTQASTIPTQQVSGIQKKGNKKTVGGVKGGQKRIPTNLKQNQQTRKKIQGANNESESTSADQKSSSSSKNQAFDMLQQRIKDEQHRQQTENAQNQEQNIMFDDEDGEYGYADNQDVILDDLDGDLYGQENNIQQDQELDLSRPSDGMLKVQQHLFASIGKLQGFSVEAEDQLNNENTNNDKNGADTSIDLDPEPSARIEHNIDGTLKLNIDQEQIVSQQLGNVYGGQQSTQQVKKTQYQLNNIQEECDQDESLDFYHKKQDAQNRSQLAKGPDELLEMDKRTSDVIIELEDGLPDEYDDPEEDLILFIEYKYCTICHIEQPLRCKHCKQCDHCVATHDHHCPWIGNCVGERNRFYFFWFIQTQFMQLFTALFICMWIVIWHEEDNNQLNNTHQVLVLFAFLVSICFTLFVFPLVLFHSYLASQNLTSWEFMSWMRITYLKVWPKKYGSPFNEGKKANFRMYCCYNFRKQKQCYKWRMPKSLPKLKK